MPVCKGTTKEGKPCKLHTDGKYCRHHQKQSTSTPRTSPVLGSRSYPNGDQYEGQMLNDMPHGTGTMRYSDGSFFTGLWNKGEYVDGSRGYDNGGVYRGTWKNNMYKKGKLHFPFLDDKNKSFEGTWNKNKATGTLTYANGLKVTGDFEYNHNTNKFKKITK